MRVKIVMFLAVVAFQDLNTLIPPGSGWELSDATGINDSGQIVCDDYNTGGEHHAFLLNKQ